MCHQGRTASRGRQERSLPLGDLAYWMMYFCKGLKSFCLLLGLVGDSMLLLDRCLSFSIWSRKGVMLDSLGLYNNKMVTVWLGSFKVDLVQWQGITFVWDTRNWSKDGDISVLMPFVQSYTYTNSICQTKYHIFLLLQIAEFKNLHSYKLL